MISISLGATICSHAGTFNLQRIRSVSKQLDDLASGGGYRLAVVVGAGGASRPYLDMARKYEERKKRIDELAVEVSRANAMVLIAGLRARGAKVFPRPLIDLREIDEDWFNTSSGMIAVLGCILPGLTSDSVAALISKRFRCPLWITSTKGRIQQTDPKNSKLKKRPDDIQLSS